MATELADTATKEDIDKFVEEIMTRDQKTPPEEEAKEEKVDEAQDKPSEDKPGDETPAEQGSVGEDADEDEDEEESSDQEWLDDDLRSEVSALGISEQELAGFSNREELERAMRFLDLGALKAGKAGKETEEKTETETSTDSEETPRGKDGRFAPKESKAPKEETYAVKLSADEFDEAVVNEFKGLHSHVERELKSLKDELTRLVESERQRAAEVLETQFDAIVDSLGHADLFGVTGKESEKQLENRQKLFDSSHVMLAGLERLGRQGRWDKGLISRALRVEFADHLSKQERKNLTRKLTKQSNLRQGGANGKPSDPEETLEEFASRRIKELERS
jgi:hypothetical protein